MRYVHAADYAEGLAASLKAGIAAVPPEAAAAIVCLGDMPLVTGRMIDRLLEAYDPDEGRLIVLPTFRGKQGNPMLWDRRFFPEILGITGDSGARFLLGKHLEQVAEVEMADDAVVRDFDTADALATLPERLRPGPCRPADGRCRSARPTHGACSISRASPARRMCASPPRTPIPGNGFRRNAGFTTSWRSRCRRDWTPRRMG